MEDNLRALATDLSETDRRKDEFLAMLAHELRNPLAPIRNALQILRLSEDEQACERAGSVMGAASCSWSASSMIYWTSAELHAGNWSYVRLAFIWRTS
ncbi:MAG: histidine kinase dimerization/phospho-acceptor domain-containing protein [Planctomycetaceae bacterium]